MYIFKYIGKPSLLIALPKFSVVNFVGTRQLQTLRRT